MIVQWLFFFLWKLFTSRNAWQQGLANDLIYRELPRDYTSDKSVSEILNIFFDFWNNSLFNFNEINKF
jgi:hypothetical protein